MGARFSEWLDSQSRSLFITPAVVLILLFSIFPLVASLVISLTNFRRLNLDQREFVWFRNFERHLFGSSQDTTVGVLRDISIAGWFGIILTAGLLLWWMVNYVRKEFTVIGFVGRLITAGVLFGIGWLFSVTLLSGHMFGAIGMTLIYVFVGCGFQFVIGLGLAFLCAQQIKGRTFFRVAFFVPLMITPIGVAYAFRMLADPHLGPLAPMWEAIGLGEFAWSTDPWSARIFIIVGDSWQWIPFIFVVMLAALENVPRDFFEAAEVDGAGRWQIFREITWPQVMPVAATVLLIRMIEAFKIVDLVDVMTSGGPGSSTMSMTYTALEQWLALDLNEASAIAYLLLFITVVVCVSFFNLVVLRHVRKAA